MKTLLAAALFVIPALVLAADDKEPLHTKDSLETIKKNVAEGKAVIVDVREQNEWDAGHLKGAILIPSSKLKVDAKLAELTKKLDKEKIIYTHCRAGRRALACAEILKKQGFDVRAIKAGYEVLVKAGFEKAEDKK